MSLDWPPNWDAIFGRQAPLIVELGFGNGQFLVGLAQQFPDYNIIGIERAHKPLQWAENLIEKKKLTNVRIIQGDAMMSAMCLLTPASVHAFHLNFSDPWFKTRHHNRRMVNEQITPLLANRLVTGGHLFIATDIEPYAEQINETLHQTAGIQSAYVGDYRTEREDPYVRTHYEKKARRIGRTCFYFKYVRDETPLTIDQYKELEMPNAVLSIPDDLSLEDIAQQFEEKTFRHDDRTAKLFAIYQHPKRPILLFEVILNEPMFQQQLMIALKKRDGGDYVLKLSTVGYPRATRSVHDAVHHIVEWLTSLHPDVTVTNATIRKP